MSVIKKTKKVLDTAADVSGARSVVKVGAHLAKNAVRVARGQNANPNLYPTKNPKELAKDAAGIVGLGATALGAVQTLGAKAAAKAAPAAPKAVSEAAKAFDRIKEVERVNAHRFMRFFRGGKY